MAISAQLIEESSAAPLNQICVQTLIGVIHARRGEPEAWRALDSAIANAAPTAPAPTESLMADCRAVPAPGIRRARSDCACVG